MLKQINAKMTVFEAVGVKLVTHLTLRLIRKEKRKEQKYFILSMNRCHSSNKTHKF